jgi:DNA modification methylase
VGNFELNKIYNESNLETMARMPDNFIDLTVTSPPYDGLRSYNGYSFPFEDISKELYRVTKQGGVVVWVVGDSCIDGGESGTSFKQALFFIQCGFNLHDTMIYKKNNFIPLNHKRYEQVFEYMFVFSKGKPNTFNAIKIRSLTAGCKKNWKNLGATKDLEDSNKLKQKNEITTTDEYRIKDNIWDYNVGQNQSTKDTVAFEHPAIYPEKLAYDHIKSWSNENDIIYDPFMGSGTTAKAAISANRKWIGSEISEEYCKIIEKRLQPLLHNLFT